MALDAILNQLHDAPRGGSGEAGKGRRRPICIYVAIGQKESKVVKIAETLKKYDALQYSIIVSASASSPAAMWYLAPYAGCAIGEYFRDKGEDALIVYDDLSKHAWAYRQISLFLRRPPGREAYPGDIFYLHSRLLDGPQNFPKSRRRIAHGVADRRDPTGRRDGIYSNKHHLHNRRPDLFLESDLFNQGQRPALNVGISVSRVGSAAQTKAMKKVAGKLRLSLAQFRELQAFVQFATDVDEGTKKKILQGQKINEILKQDDLVPLPFEKQVCVFYAVLNNYFEKVDVADIKKAEIGLVEYLEKFHEEDILKPIREKPDNLTKRSRQN